MNETLGGTDIKVSTIADGDSITDVELYEARAALATDAQEVEMIVNISKEVKGD